MRILSLSECKSWEELTAWSSGADTVKLKFAPPQCHYRLLDFLESLTAVLSNVRGLLWFRDWPLYREYQMRIFQNFRKGMGRSQALIKGPGHYLNDEEGAEFIGLLFFALIFRWDATHLSQSGAFQITAHHHETLTIEIPKAHTLLTTNINLLLTNYKVEILHGSV